MKIKGNFRENLIPAIKDKEIFEAALISHNEIVFVIMSNIINIKEIVLN